MFTADYIQELDKITGKYEQRRAALLPVLHFVQDKDLGDRRFIAGIAMGQASPV